MLDVADDGGDSDDARKLRPLQAAASTYSIAFGTRAGQNLLTVHGAMPREPGFERAFCANVAIQLPKSATVEALSANQWK
jgi:hypothetical protein